MKLVKAVLAVSIGAAIGAQSMSAVQAKDLGSIKNFGVKQLYRGMQL